MACSKRLFALPGSTEVKHLLYALVTDYGLEEIQQRVTRALSGLRCAAFYGCYLLRAQKSMPYDDPYHEAMENVFGQWVQSITEVERSGVALPAMQLRNLSRWRGCIFRTRSHRVQIVWLHLAHCVTLI